jgi:hypothetical protein
MLFFDGALKGKDCCADNVVDIKYTLINGHFSRFLYGQC